LTLPPTDTASPLAAAAARTQPILLMLLGIFLLALGLLMWRRRRDVDYS